MYWYMCSISSSFDVCTGIYFLLDVCTGIYFYK